MVMMMMIIRKIRGWFIDDYYDDDAKAVMVMNMVIRMERMIKMLIMMIIMMIHKGL